MRKYILFLMLLCMHCVARGQTGFDYRYWFDNDYSRVNDGHSATGQWQLEADLSGLSESLHTIHLQVVDDKDNPSSPVTRFFLKVRDTSAKQGYYWFDSDRKNQLQMEQVQGLFNIDVSKLTEGFHTFYYQVVGTDGSFSPIVSRSFYRVVIPKQSRYRCWVDDEPSTMTVGQYTGAPVLIDISQISEGYHIMRVQVEDVTPSAVVNRPFVKIPQTEGVEHLTCLCSVDGKLFRTEDVPSTGGIVNWDFDVSSLPQGFHRMQVQVITPSGAATSTYDAFFLRTTTTDEMSQMKCVYAIDGKEFNTEAGSMAGGVFHCDLDVSHLEDGLHRIAYKLTNGKGVETQTQTQFFMKTPVGGNGITEYRYWLNNSTEQMNNVQLNQRITPFKLISLLPVPKHPVRSSLFHFEEKDGKPMMYAKNDFHIRFYDVSGRFTDASEQFIDYSVSREVEPVGELQATQTFAKVAENDVRWYTVEVAPGDTLAFKLSQPATVQVFAPYDEELKENLEVFKTSGSASLNWNGIHVWKDGIYYVAVHDVTGSQSTITLEYMHMDKYDVVDWDVHTVGNGGCSTITFKGNGFRDLYAVDLVVAPGDTIHSVDVSHDSDAETAVTFDFTDATLGEYKAVFHFTEEDKYISDIISVEEAKDFDFDIKATFASQYLRGTANRYTFKIRNNSNMTAYHVPMPIHIYTPDYTTLLSVEVGGYDVKQHLKDIAGANYTDSLDVVINDRISRAKDMWYFLKNSTTTAVDGCPYYFHAFICPDLRPNTTETFTVSITSTGTSSVYMWCSPYVQKSNYPERNSGKRRATVIDDYNCGSLLEHARQCADNEKMRELNLEPTYDVDCPPPNNSNCPDNGDGGSSNPQPPADPNDIYGYLSQAGSKFIVDSLARVNYTIEFENDTTFATAAAHTIVIKDTLDSKYFDLTKFMPTGVRIGGHEVFLDESDVVTNNDKTTFVKTIDMRPEINAIAQVEGEYNQKNGIAQWTFQSLDPMTMEPTDDLMQGILPVNYNGTSGIGEVMFEIGVKQGKADGAQIKNRAGIVFDYEEAILTPTWTNIVDAVAPNSIVDGLTLLNDSTLRVFADASDARSGVWKYEWYVQHGENAPWWKEGETNDDCFDFHFYEGFDYGFCVVVTDSAGNVEKKELARERIFKSYGDEFEEAVSLNPLSASPNGDSRIYDLSGRRHDEPQEGVNIINKKKILFRRRGK